MTSSLIQAASTITSLAFTAFFEASVNEASQKLSEATISRINTLRQAVWNRIKGIPETEDIKKSVNTKGFLRPEELQPLIPALAAAMESDPDFANQISQFAADLSTAPGVSKLLGQNIQAVSDGVGTQVNSPTSPVFTGTISGGTFNIHYDQTPSSETSKSSSTKDFNSPTQRLALFQRLVTFPITQFEQALFALNPPPGNIPSAHAPQGERVKALLDWADSIGPGLKEVEITCDQISQPSVVHNQSNSEFVETLIYQKSQTLSSSDAVQIENFLQRSEVNARTLTQGCLALRKEQGLNLVFEQIDWIYQLARIADGEIPSSALPRVKPTGRIRSVAWMKAQLRRNLPSDCLCRISQTIGSFGDFSAEISPHLAYMFASPEYSEKDRDEALIYLCLIGSSVTTSQLVEIADMTANNEKDYFHSRSFFGLLLIDNVDIIAGQILKLPPYPILSAYAYGLAGSKNPRGKSILHQMSRHNHQYIRAVAVEALNKF